MRSRDKVPDITRLQSKHPLPINSSDNSPCLQGNKHLLLAWVAAKVKKNRKERRPI
jgi:hypothetical protein